MIDKQGNFDITVNNDNSNLESGKTVDTITVTDHTSEHTNVEIQSYRTNNNTAPASSNQVTVNHIVPIQKQTFCQKIRKNATYRRKFIQTLFLWWTGMTCGWISGQVGPSLLDLQVITQTSFEKASRLLTVGSVGFLIGSMTGGFLFGRFSSHVILFWSLFSSAVITAVIPWCMIYEVMMTAMLVRQIFLGASDTVINAELLCIWRLKNRSYMQALHFAFAFGGIVSPLATAPFLVPEPDATSMNSSNGESTTVASTFNLILELSDIHKNTFNNSYRTTKNVSLAKTLTMNNELSNLNSNTSCCDATTNNAHYVINSSVISQNTTVDSVVTSYQFNVNNSTTSQVFLTESRIFIAFILTAFLALSCSCIYLILCIRIRSRKRKLNKIATDTQVENSSHCKKLPRSTRILIILIMMVLIGVYNAIEESFAGFLTTFCVKQLLWNKTLGSIATSVFWATFGGGRFLGIFLIRLCSPACMIDLYGIMSILAFIGLLLSAMDKCYIGIWVCIAIIGFSLSVFSPTIFTWTEEILHVTGNIASSLKIAANTGSMINSLVLGILMDRLSPLWFNILLLGESVFIFILCIIATLFSRKLKDKIHSQTYTDITLPSENLDTKL